MIAAEEARRRAYEEENAKRRAEEEARRIAFDTETARLHAAEEARLLMSGKYQPPGLPEVLTPPKPAIVVEPTPPPA